MNTKIHALEQQQKKLIVNSVDYFKLTSNIQMNCLTASAVPRNQVIPFSPDVCVAANTWLYYKNYYLKAYKRYIS
jgi:hypothetical protein